MDTLFVVILSGMAVAYFVELISSLTSRFIPTRLLKLVLTLPLSFGANWLLGTAGFTLIVSGCATAFASLVLLMLTSRPIQVINTSRR